MIKKSLLVLIFLLSILSVSADSERVTLAPYESVEIGGVNITLLSLDDAHDKVLLCVNNKKVIVSDSRIIDDARIEIREVTEKEAKLKIDVACEDCVCDESCSNKECLPEETEDSEPIEEKIEEYTPRNMEGKLNVIPKEKEKDNTVKGFTYYLLFLVVLLMALLIIKKIIK